MKLPEQHITEDTNTGVLTPGTVVEDRYVIEAAIGNGSFAHVYRAHRAGRETQRVALKVLRPSHASDPQARANFRNEAETAAQLRSPYSTRMHHIGELEDGRPYICMDFVDGPTLAHLLSEFGPMHPHCVANYSVQILEALQEAHGHGVVHQDIKPANICIVGSHENVHVRVLDFGISQRAQLANQRNDAVLCTPSYAAPEALRGRPTYRSDLYALGLTMAEMLEGEPVYEDTGFYTVSARQLSDIMAPLKSRCVHSPLAAIIRRATSKKASDRFEDAAAMRTAIERVMTHIAPLESAWPARYCPLGTFEEPDELEGAATSVVECSPAASDQDDSSAKACSGSMTS